jgi:hypothetical protein
VITELGKVTSVRLGLEDHGILTLWLTLNFGGKSQGFGGYALSEWSKAEDRQIGHAAGTDYILRMLEFFGVDTLEKIVGRPVYALRAKDALNEPIVGLETPPFDGDRAFLVSAWQRRWFPKEKK